MASKRKPLDDARRRLKEKLGAIDEQKEFIQNSVDQLTTEVKKAANSLLSENNKTKFFNKYRAVSQELEKCLDDLLLISATISSLEDDEEEEDDEESEGEEDEKPPDDLLPTAATQEHIPVAQSKREEPSSIAAPRTDESSPVDKNQCEIPSLIGQKFADPTSGFPNEVKNDSICDLRHEKTPEASRDAKNFRPVATQSPVLFADEITSTSSDSTRQSEVPKELIESSCDEAKHSKAISLSTTDETADKHVEPELQIINKSSVCKDVSTSAVEQSNSSDGKEGLTKDSRTYEKDLFIQRPSLNTADESISIEMSSPKEHENYINVLEQKSKKNSSKVENMMGRVSTSTVRLERTGFCEYKSYVIANDGKELETNIQPVDLPSNTDKRGFDNREEAESCKIAKTSLPAVEKPIAGDVIEQALNENPPCELADREGPNIPPFEFPPGKCIKVIVKDVVSPKKFWIQKADDDFDLLMEKMCYYFAKRAKAGDKGGLKEPPGVGHVCCGRYTVDNVWYRALVTAVSCENSQVEVLYVDEGNSETLPLSRLRDLDKKFAHLPSQALCVQLRGLELREGVKLDEVNDWFKRRMSGEALDAFLIEDEAHVKPVPIDLYISAHDHSANVESRNLVCNVHEMLIREGFAIRALSPRSTGATSDASPPSSLSDQVPGVRSESVSSTVTSGFHDAPSPTLDVSTVNDVRSQSPRCHGSDVISRVPPPVIPVDSDGSVFMLVSYVVNPGEFYVHFISSEAGMLDGLLSDMNQTYQELQSQNASYDDFSPRVGDFCCAKYSTDGNWYRGLVLQVRCSHVDDDAGAWGEKKGAITVEVFYIDFGNIEQVEALNLRKLLPQFMVLPAQVVRCSLADVYPSVKQTELDVFHDGVLPEEDYESNKKFRRKRRNESIVIAAGDEDSGDEFPTGDGDTLGLLPDIEEHHPSDRLRSSISEDIAKSHRESSLFSDTAVELFEKVWSGVERISLLPSWSENATNYFKTLTLNAQKLVGFIVPWDSEVFNNIVNYSPGSECSLPNLGPVLRLNLYDISQDEDVFVNGAMVRAKYAASSSIKCEEDALALPKTMEIEAEESCVIEGPNEDKSREEELPDVRVHARELSAMAETSQDSRTTPPPSHSPSSPSSPISPTSRLMDQWNPMSDDHSSLRNAYNVETDNLDVAITGYEEDRGKICRFYRTKYGCFRGSKCPDKHVEHDVSNQIVIYGSPATSLTMPDVGAWVLVKITAIYNPAHFWVQLPYGVESLKTQLIKSRSGAETSGEENLKDFNNLNSEMTRFYSKRFTRERSLVPPTEGELVVVRSRQDNQWYRGQVCKEKHSQYKVVLVDYGITEWVNRTDICPMMPQFLHLPFQSVECYLANIAPKSEQTGDEFRWSEDSRQHFKSMIEDKLLVCQVLSIGTNKTMSVALFESENGESRSVTEKMIQSGYANDAEPITVDSVQPKAVILHPG